MTYTHTPKVLPRPSDSSPELTEAVAMRIARFEKPRTKWENFVYTNQEYYLESARTIIKQVREFDSNLIHSNPDEDGTG